MLCGVCIQKVAGLEQKHFFAALAAKVFAFCQSRHSTVHRASNMKIIVVYDLYTAYAKPKEFFFPSSELKILKKK